jgi:hypothetical protein
VGKDGLTDKEAAIIAAARRGLSVAAPREQANAPIRSTAVPEKPAEPTVAAAPDVPAPSKPDVAARIALLMNAELEEKERRRKKLRQIGIVIPAIILVVAILAVAGAILRFIRS